MLFATTRSSLLRISHFAPPDAPAIVPICAGEKPCLRTISMAPNPALKLSAAAILGFADSMDESA